MDVLNLRQNGVYYTNLFNPFTYTVFMDWITKHNIMHETILEPFAGENSIIEMLKEVGLAQTYQSYDVYPQSPMVKKRDTIMDYPSGYSVCITNPPWLYKSSAHRRGLSFPDTHYDDMYKLCLSLALGNNKFVGALIPASFMQSGLFTDRLERVVFLNKPLFKNTEHPVVLALFGAEETDDIELYDDDVFIGLYQDLLKHLPEGKGNDVTFNVPDGDLGFIAIDNNIEPSIKFCLGRELEKYNVHYSSRSITRISGAEVSSKRIDRLNTFIDYFRKKTNDIFLTAFKGLRKDGKYRRRMDYSLARSVIEHVK